MLLNEKTLNHAPLAEQIRPKKIQDIVGQNHLTKEGGSLAIIAQNKLVPSLILHGPTGVGKTTIAKILAEISESHFIILSAINSGVAELRKTIDEAKKIRGRKSTILMIDEIHHFNKTQQDFFLPFIEDGTIILIATTTENPSFHINSALLSRTKVLALEPLNKNELNQLIKRAESFKDKKLPIEDKAKELLIDLSCGDGRYLLNSCEELFLIQNKILNSDDLLKIITKKSANFDKKGDNHYNLISAFHKSLRGSDVDAALYYLARMLIVSQDPYYILRRLARFATEDIGIADPQAIVQVMAAKENYDFLGSPEGDYALSYATIYCATAPKSNAAYLAHKMAIEQAKNSANLQPPKHILNAPTKLMKEDGIGKGYIYDHDTKHCFSGQEYFPEELSKKENRLYAPNERGFEREIKKRIEYWKKLKRNQNI